MASKDTQIRLCFSMFTSGGGDSIPVTSIADFFRSLGLQISQADCDKISSGLGKDQVTLDDVLPAVNERMAKSDKSTITNTLKEAINIYDHGSGSLSKKQFVQTMTSCGEAVSGEEVDKILQGISVDGDGKIKTNDLIQKLTAGI